MPAHLLLISNIELKGTGDSIESIEIDYDNHRHSIPRRGKSLFQENFDQPLVARGNTISLLIIHRRRWHIGPKQAPEVIEISVREVLTKLPAQKFQTECHRLAITLGLSPNSVPDITGSSRDALRPTTEELLDECPRFRLLVIGQVMTSAVATQIISNDDIFVQPGVGKSALINRVFGIEQAFAQDSQPGKADIEKELIPQQNDRFVLHESKGFEVVDGVDRNGVKLFIEDRKKREHVKDKLHAVWLCFQIPIPGHGDRLLGDGAETFLKEDTSVLQDIPTIVVFTKYDRLLTFMRMQNEADPDAAAEQYLQEYCIRPIQNFDKDPKLSYVGLSSKPGCDQSLDHLIDITYEKVTETFEARLGAPSPVSVAALMAQRILPHLKIEGSIAVGKQSKHFCTARTINQNIHTPLEGFWRTLASSPSFPGHTIRECLRVIHTDIVSIWNFHDQSGHLGSESFQEVMVSMVGTIDESPRPSCSDSYDTITQDTAPLEPPTIVPFATGLASARWADDIYYYQMNNLHQSFMAYIVDLIHILEILFTLTANDNQWNLTRRAIQIAFNAYHYSKMRRYAHAQIRAFDSKVPGGDPVLDTVVSLVRTSRIDHVDIVGAVRSIILSEVGRYED
ncbi:hypothetical protein EDD15DRAFT_2533113 [Pisolithus albus]|nr:hypothetical protein EDD15DRAFT_2533113 [Pisolithus albus]